MQWVKVPLATVHVLVLGANIQFLIEHYNADVTINTGNKNDGVLNYYSAIIDHSTFLFLPLHGL